MQSAALTQMVVCRAALGTALTTLAAALARANHSLPAIASTPPALAGTMPALLLRRPLLLARVDTHGIALAFTLALEVIARGRAPLGGTVGLPWALTCPFGAG